MNTPKGNAKNTKQVPSTKNESIISDKKIQIETVIDHKEFAGSLSFKIENFDNFIVFNSRIQNEISNYFIKKLHLKSRGKNFCDSFRISNLSIFRGTEEERFEIMDLIDLKNSTYQKFLLEMIRKGNINLPKDDINDISAVINCGILKLFDEQYKLFEKGLKSVENKDFGELYYGIPVEGKVKSYRAALGKNEITKEFLEINNEELKIYIFDAVGLSSMGIYSYDHWVKAEKSEVKNWLSDSNLVFISPMENYAHKNFIEPEYGIFLRTKTEEKPKDFGDLSKRHYESDFGIEKVNVFMIEPLLMSGDFAYSQFLGKNFPNDPKLRSEFGNFIGIVKGRFGKTFDEYSKMISKIFNTDTDEIIGKKEQIVTGSLKEVIYHEYGHNIFETKDTMLEETKATLFYWLHVYEECIIAGKSIEIKDIEKIINSFTLDFTRYVSRFDKSQYRKYLITSEVLLHHFLDKGLLKYNKEKNHLDINIQETKETIEKFKDFVIELKRLLDKIHDIYKSGEVERVDKIVAYYDEKSLPIIENLFKNFKH